MSNDEPHDHEAFMRAARQMHEASFSYLNMRESDWEAFSQRNRAARPQVRPGAQSLEIEVRSGRGPSSWAEVVGSDSWLKRHHKAAAPAMDPYHPISPDISASGGKHSRKPGAKSESVPVEDLATATARVSPYRSRLAAPVGGLQALSRPRPA